MDKVLLSLPTMKRVEPKYLGNSVKNHLEKWLHRTESNDSKYLIWLKSAMEPPWLHDSLKNLLSEIRHLNHIR